MNKIDVLTAIIASGWMPAKTPRAPCRDRAKKRKRGRVQRMSRRVNRSR